MSDMPPTLAGVRAVIFDLDGTLLDRRQSFRSFVSLQWQRFALLLEYVDRDEYIEALVRLDQDGYAPRDEAFAELATMFGLPSNSAVVLLSDYRAGFPGACRLFPDVAETLASLRAAGMKLGIITNGSFRMQSKKLECLALETSFDTILISGAEGIHKPDAEIFRRAAERLHVNLTEAVFIGDHPEVDIRGAKRAGMRAVWRRDPLVSAPLEADAWIDQISELLPLLRPHSA